jgi:predicted ATPase
MLHLREIALKPIPAELDHTFPFSVPALQSLNSIELKAPVTFFVGENGSGKSTLLEGLACAVDIPAVGGEPLCSDSTLDAVRPLADYLKLSWTARNRNGFFLRAEDFFGFAKRIQRLEAGLKVDEARIKEEYAESGRTDYARSLQLGPIYKELSALKRRYGEGLDSQSHGESFLTLFQNRFVPNGIYLLDEPEAPLSPIRQLGFLSLLKEMVETQNAQFIIATHSPILMAYPRAQILSFDEGQVQAVDWDSLEHVTLTRDFLNNPETFLRYM